ncbi:MAG: beta-ketoacyl-[acyl-carrier-protein] synthase family protein [Proteobacteria bacterium]|nr:beta-ketoacyl-[acyl-carrier-protein] synthase family protein [Pseudomonadota bacterium]
MPPVAIRAHTATTALGRGRQAQADALHAGRSGLRRNDFSHAPLDCWIGRVAGVEDEALPEALSAWECRNNRLAWIALQQDGVMDALREVVERHGADRVALVVGTSTSSIGATEDAYERLVDDAFPADLARPIIHTPHSLGHFLQHATGLRGPSITVATACSSSAKVFAQAARLIQSGVVDAALVGGVDTLCGSVLFGFNSLGLVSTQPCRPFDAQRDGISLGEAGGFAVLERIDGDESGGLRLLGYGESSDAHHMSTPHPEGLGAQLAMRDALARAGLEAMDIDHLNLHGTATPANDRVEMIAISAMFPDSLHAASTKGFTGHTLGAAGIVESVFALIALEDGILPATLNGDSPDPGCGPQIRFAADSHPIRHAMNNSFGFGGNNCSLVFGRA